MGGLTNMPFNSTVSPNFVTGPAMRRIFTAIIPLILTLACLGYAGYMYFSGGNGDANASEASTKTNSADTVNQTELKYVSVWDRALGGQNEGLFTTGLGVVESSKKADLYGAQGSAVKYIAVEEGEEVKEGDLIMVLGGANGATHQYETQYKIALQSFESAKTAYSNTVTSMDAAVEASRLQVNNAGNQSQAAYIDYMNVVDGVGRAQRGIDLSRSTLYETKMQNERNRDNLIDAINDMEDNLYDLDGPERDALEKEINKMEDQLDALDSGSFLSENQMMGQIEQAYAQYAQARTTSESMLLKIGYNGNGEFDSVKLAEAGLKSTVAQRNSAIAQAEAQLKMASINLESARELQGMLNIRAPFSGTVGVVNTSEGEMVNPQMPVASVYGEGGFVLKTAVGVETSKRIVPGALAEVKIGNRILKLPVLSVAGGADARSRLVDVKIKTGNLGLTPNQTLPVRLPLADMNEVNGGDLGDGDGETGVSIPLDCLIVATGEKFVFVYEGNEDSGNEGIAKQVIVTTGEIAGDYVEILSGLSGSEKLVMEGAREIKDGEKVIVK